MDETLYSSKWWLSVVLVGLLISISANYIYKFTNWVLGLISDKAKIRNQENKKKDNIRIKYLSSNYNILSLRLIENTHFLMLVILCLIGFNFLGEVCIILIFKSNLGNTYQTGPQLLLLFIIACSGGTLFLGYHSHNANRLVSNAVEVYIDNNTIGKYFNGKWQLAFEKNNIVEKEIVEMKNENQYFKDNEFAFFIKNFQVNIDTNQIVMEKYNLSGTLHSVENINIIDSDNFAGFDTLGYKLKYQKIA